MTRLWKAAAVTFLLATTACAGESGAPEGYRLVWSDEFSSGTLPDPAKWDYDTNRNKDGWWNNEAQYYSKARPENSRVEDGHLIIETRIEDLTHLPDHGGQKYSSVRLVTRGKAEWTYGFYDIRAKLPCGRGQWPAIWLLGVGQWPDTGEIDIMEAVGHEPTTIYGTTHSRATVDAQSPKGGQTTLETRCSQFHNYQADWRPDSITFLIDGKPYFRLDKPAGADWKNWPYDTPEYLILNIAVGGAWGGQQGIDESVFPARMEVDYVRIYQKR